MKVLLSIKPEFANLIFDGSKQFEFRKAIFKNPKVKTVVVYASSPVQRVIGEFDIEKIICQHPTQLWKLTRTKAGIDKDFFDAYFEGRDIAYAISVGATRLYKTPKKLREAYNLTPPQSYCYL